MSKRSRHDCASSCSHASRGHGMTAEESRLSEEIFGSLCSVIEGYQHQQEEKAEGSSSSSVPPFITPATLKQARQMFDAYLTEIQMQNEAAEAKMAKETSSSAATAAETGGAGGAPSSSSNDAASPTTNSVLAERGQAVITLCNKLNTVRKQLRQWAPYGSLAASETLITPQKSDAFDASVPTFEIDNFLYPDDDDVEALCEKGLVSRNYCLKCKSTETAPTQFVSHSFSRDQLLFITCFLTPYLEAVARREDRDAARPIEKVVDVGSRLGIVLTSFHFSCPTVKQIVGIELNPTLCQLQQRLLKAHRIADDRCLVVNANVLSEAGLAELQSADVVILHNVFEWFSSEADQLGIWIKIRNALSRKGQWLIIAPKLEESLTCLASAFDKAFDVAKFISSWVEEMDVSEPRDQFVTERKGGLYGSEDPSFGAEDDEDEEEEIPEFAEQCENIHVYRVL